MARIGIAAPPLLGHVHPMMAIGRELTRRGHDVVFLSTGQTPPAVGNAGFAHLTVGDGSNQLSGISARRGGLRQTIALVREMARSTRMMAHGLVPSLRRCAFDGLLVDQLEPGAALAALATRTP